MNGSRLRWGLPVVVFLSLLLLLPGTGYAKVDAQIDPNQLVEELDYQFVPVDMNDQYVIGKKRQILNDELWILDLKTGEAAPIRMPEDIYIENMILINDTIIFLTYRYSTVTAADHTFFKIDIDKGDVEKLLEKGYEDVVLKGASEYGFIYTTDSVSKGSDLYYYDFHTEEDIRLKYNVKFATMHKDLVVYSVDGTGDGINREIYYLNLNDRDNRIRLPYNGEWEVKANDRYIVYWRYIKGEGWFESFDYIYFYDRQTGETLLFDEYGTGSLLYQGIELTDDFFIWNTIDEEKAATYIYEPKNDFLYELAVPGLKPIAANSTHVLLSLVNTNAIYSLPLPETSNGETADEYFQQGVVLYSVEKYEEALDCFDEAIALDGSKYEYHYFKAAALNELERYQEALTAVDRALALHKDGEVYLLKAITLSALKRYEESYEVMLLVISYDNQNPDYYNFIGSLLIELERYEEALDAYQSALALDPSNEDALAGKQLAEELIAEAEKPHTFPSKPNVAVDHLFTVKFNLEIDKNTVNKNNLLVYDVETGELVDIQIIPGDDPKTIKFAPVQPYQSEHNYRILIKKGITTKTGKPLKKEAEMYFTTA